MASARLGDQVDSLAERHPAAAREGLGEGGRIERLSRTFERVGEPDQRGESDRGPDAIPFAQALERSEERRRVPRPSGLERDDRPDGETDGPARDVAQGVVAEHRADHPSSGRGDVTEHERGPRDAALRHGDVWRVVKLLRAHEDPLHFGDVWWRAIDRGTDVAEPPIHPIHAPLVAERHEAPPGLERQVQGGRSGRRRRSRPRPGWRRHRRSRLHRRSRSPGRTRPGTSDRSPPGRPASRRSRRPPTAPTFARAWARPPRAWRGWPRPTAQPHPDGRSATSSAIGPPGSVARSRRRRPRSTSGWRR